MTFYRTEVLADSPLIYLNYDAESLTANLGSRTGVIVNSSGGYAWANGFVGRAPDFTGPGTAARINYNLNGNTQFNTNTWTVEMWFKVDAFTSGYLDLFQINDGSNVVTAYFDYSNAKKLTVRHKAQAGTLYTVATTHVQNTSWHHFAMVRNGTNLSAYIDGTSVVSTTIAATNPNFANTANFIVGAYGDSAGNENFDGLIDEVAIYSTNLSPTRITAHSVGTATQAGGYTAEVMTATGAAPGGTGVGNVQTLSIVDDVYVSSTLPGSNYGAQTNTAIGTVTTLIGLFRKATSAANGEIVTSETLYIKPETHFNTTHSYGVYRITSTWDEATVTWTTKPTMTLIKTVGVADTSIATGFLAIDVAGVDTGNGYAIADTASHTYYSSEHATPANRPYVVMTTAPQANLSYNATPGTATSNMPDPTVDATDTVSASGQPMTASSTLVSPVVVAQQFVDEAVTAEPMAGSALMTSSGFAVPTTVTAEVTTGSAELTAPAVATQRGPRIAVPPMAAVATWLQPALVNGAPIIASEADDRYFQRVFAEFPKSWFRLADAGSVAVDRMGGASGAYHGVQVHRFNAPDNRHSVYFDGTASIEQAEPEGTNLDEALLYGNAYPQSTLEFSFKTTKPNEFLLVSKDSSTGVVNTSPSPARELYLRDGKISYRTHYFVNSLGVQKAPYEFTGFKNLADDQWHTIVIKGLSERFGERGVEVWVDGKLEIRRTTFSGAGELHGFPDWIGSRPSSVDGVEIGALPSSLNFVGEMSEVVFFSHLVSDHAIARHYYDFMGWRPIEADSADGFAFMTADNRGKGNQKRALALYFTNAEDAYNIGGGSFSNKMNFNPFVGFPAEFAGYKMFYKRVDNNNGQPYRDPVTDAQTLISLEHDLNINDYDVIMFKEWPDEGYEIDQLDHDVPGARERLIDELRWANEQGIGLFITHPRLAVDLGIVDRVEFIETLKESSFSARQGNSFGNYDYGSAAKFPWNIAASSGLEGSSTVGSTANGQLMNTAPTYLEGKAFYYEDMNFNNRFRVAALIDGLTDIPSYMVSDAIYQEDYDPWGWQISAFKYLHRYDGLQIGDEFLFYGTNIAAGEWGSANFDNYRVGRPQGYFAAPVANVKAGTIVTTFGATHWKDKEEISNPYRNYATTIVLRPGDVLAGRPVGGKIYVNFTEQPSRQPETIAVQVLPANNADFPYTYNPDTAAQKEWEWSDTRKTLRSTQESGVSATVNITLPNGEVAQIMAGDPGGDKLTMTRSSNLFPIQYKASWQMNRRGLYWLGDRIEVDPGAATVASAPMTATGTAVSPVVVAQRDNNINAQAMVSLAVMPKVAEDSTGAADINTLPMTASGLLTGYGKTITVAPMTAVAEFTEGFEMVHATGEQVVLYLHGFDTTLYLKEEV